MDKNQFSRPAEYLRDGFLDAAGKPVEGINGEYSLGMAYHLLDAGLTGADIDGVRRDLANSFEGACTAAGDLSTAALPDSVTTSLRDSATALRSKSDALDELFATAVTKIHDWRSYAVFIKHLERIQQQMSLIARFRKEEPAHAA